MPGVEHIGISRRIADENERTRLKEMINALKPPNVGFIIRTASEGCTEEEIKKDIDFLMLMWQNIESKKDRAHSPHLLYSDLDLAFRSVRDLLGSEVNRLIIDSEKEHERLIEFINTYFPKLISKIDLYEGDEPIFDEYGIELEIPKSLGKRVWLKSGGYIVIDHLEDTLLKTNLEAVREIAYQIRLRNLGGIIIIDFIDMEKEENRNKLFTAFQEAMSKDRMKSTILQVSELGLIQMTRKRVRENLGRSLCEPCSYCEGRGFIKSTTTVCYEIFRELRKLGKVSRNGKVMITCHPLITDLLYEEEREGLEEIEKTFGFKSIVKADKNYHQEYYEVIRL
jgi:ribonuclease G